MTCVWGTIVQFCFLNQSINQSNLCVRRNIVCDLIYFNSCNDVLRLLHVFLYDSDDSFRLFLSERSSAQFLFRLTGESGQVNPPRSQYNNPEACSAEWKGQCEDLAPGAAIRLCDPRFDTAVQQQSIRVMTEQQCREERNGMKTKINVPQTAMIDRLLRQFDSVNGAKPMVFSLPSNRYSPSGRASSLEGGGVAERDVAFRGWNLSCGIHKILIFHSQTVCSGANYSEKTDR